jgi:hypothetical protein
MDFTVEFTDRVTDFGTREGRVNVLFAKQAANYELSVGQSDFVELVARLAAAWKSRTPVKVTVDGVNIISVGKV